MLKSHIRLGKLSGIPVNIDASWLLIFIWVTWSLAGSYFPQRHPAWSTALHLGCGGRDQPTFLHLRASA